MRRHMLLLKYKLGPVFTSLGSSVSQTGVGCSKCDGLWQEQMPLFQAFDGGIQSDLNVQARECVGAIIVNKTFIVGIHTDIDSD